MTKQEGCMYQIADGTFCLIAHCLFRHEFFTFAHSRSIMYTKHHTVVGSKLKRKRTRRNFAFCIENIASIQLLTRCFHYCNKRKKWFKISPLEHSSGARSGGFLWSVIINLKAYVCRRGLKAYMCNDILYIYREKSIRNQFTTVSLRRSNANNMPCKSRRGAAKVHIPSITTRSGTKAKVDLSSSAFEKPEMHSRLFITKMCHFDLSYKNVHILFEFLS